MKRVPFVLSLSLGAPAAPCVFSPTKAILRINAGVSERAGEQVQVRQPSLAEWRAHECTPVAALRGCKQVKMASAALKDSERASAG